MPLTKLKIHSLGGRHNPSPRRQPWVPNHEQQKRPEDDTTVLGITNVKHSEFPDAKHSAANAAVFSSVELFDWMLGFSRTQ